MENKLLVAVIIFLCLPLIKLGCVISSTPENLIFNGYGGDDAHFYTTIKAWDFGFESPWFIPSDHVKDSFFNNPAHGPVFLLVPLGILYILLGMSPVMLFMILKILSSTLLIIVAYYFAKEFTASKNDAKTVFLLLVFTAGLGWIIAVGYRLATNPAALLEPFSLFGFGVGFFRIIEAYQALPLALCMGSVILFARKKHLLSGLVLGVSFLIYPLYAFAFFPVIVLYSIIYEKQVWLRNVLVVFFAAAPFGIPWLFSYISSPYFFGVYGCINKILGAVVLPSIALSLGIPLFFMLYSMRKRIKIVYGKFYGALWLFSLVLVSLSEISQSYWASGMDFLGIVKLAGSFYPLLEIPFYIMFAHLVWMVFKNRRNIESGHLFFMGWLFVISLLLFTPPTIAPWVPMKLIVVITIPASFIAAIGIGEFSARYKISWRKIMALIIVFSLPAIFLYYAFEITRTGMVQKDFVQQNMFYSKSDYDAMLFLKNQPDGIVLCSGYIGNFLPYYSGKKSLLFGIDRTDTVYRFDEKMSDYKKFMAGDAEVLKKYNIGYVFYGSFEKLDGKIIDDSLLEKIYDLNGAIIYRVG